MYKKVALMIMTLLPLAALAQWSSDPLVNLGIGTGTGEQVTPKIAATPDSGCYISWFDSRSGQYCMYLQKLNAGGVPQWTPNGLLISNNPQSTSLVDYDLKSDPQGNAILVFTDMRNGSANDLDVFAYKISPAGAFLWGANGVGLSAAGNTDYEANPKVACTAAGNYVVGWLKSGAANVITFQRLASTGQKMWGENGLTLSGTTGHSLTTPDLAPADNDNVVALWKDNSGAPWAPTTWLYTQKFGPTGNQMWTSGGVLIYNNGHISAWEHPQILSDGAGGAFYAWYEAPNLTNFSVAVGHVNSAGTLVFPLNGVLASTNTSQLHMNPSLAYTPASNALYVFWTETDVNQNYYGVYGQKFNSAGSRLWTDSGHEFVPLAGTQISFVSCAPENDNLYVGYFEGSGLTANAVKAFKASPAASLVWGPTLLSSADLGGKDDLVLAVNTQNRAFFAWGDGRSDFSDIYAQNVNPNGTLGNQSGPSGLDVTLTPITVPPPPPWGPFPFIASVVNQGPAQAPFWVWCRVKFPDGTYTEPTLGPVQINPPVGLTVSRNRSQVVPSTWPAGLYYELGYANWTYSYPAVDSSWFTFTKPSGGNAWGPFDPDPYCTGELFPGEQPVAASIPSGLDLGVWPNPFNPTTAISYKLQATSQVKLTVWDNAGRLVKTLVDGVQGAGQHSATFDGSRLASGMYLARLEAGGFTATQKLMLVK